MSSKKTKERKIKTQMKQQKLKEAELLEFLRNYGEAEPPQEIEKALFDNQIKSIFTSLAEILCKTQTGTFIDVGCGNGIILNRLAELQIFVEKPEWSYLGIDYLEYKMPVITLAAKADLHRKVDFLSIGDFYKNWPTNSQLSRPHFVFSRNVLHELDIEQTTVLLCHIIQNLAPGEKLIIQDLLVFPKAEKGNVCWEVDSLKSLLEDIGLTIILTEEQSKYGGRWVNVIATRHDMTALDFQTVKSLIIKYRLFQWEKWKKIGALHLNDEKFRDVRVAKIDFDLQFAALNSQLITANVQGVSQLNPAEEALILKETFDKALQSFHLEKPKNILEVVESVPYFVDRGNSKNGLEKFIVGKEKVTLIQGQPLMGKTELVKEVLSTFHHERFPIFVDVQATSSVWNLVESILGSIRCNMPSAVLSSLRSTPFSKIHDDLLTTFQKISSDIILVFDHFERLLNPGGRISDREIKEFLLSMAMTNSKIILTSSRFVDLSIFPSEVVFPEPQPPVGRFPEGPPHVNQLLGLLAGIKNCPDVIIRSIDRHPLLAVLVGLYVRKNGAKVLSDERLITELKNDMRSSLLNRIADDESRVAIDAISPLRIPVPREMLINLSSLSSVKSAEDIGLLYREKNSSRDDLLSCIGAIRYWSNNKEGSEEDSEGEVVLDAADKAMHEKIASQYQYVYRKDDDPKWLRELYYHKILSGDEKTIDEFGGYYRSEIFSAGEYWFRHKKKFDLAFWAFSIAAKFGDSGAFLRMRLASCLIRIGRKSEGESAFNELIEEFRKAKHIISSYVDSLIFINAFDPALAILNKHQINYTDGPWQAVQFGRIYMGLHKYQDAICAFMAQLNFEHKPIAYQNLARAYHKVGDTKNEMAILEKGREMHHSSKRLNVSIAALLERIGRPEDAKDILLKMFEDDPHNGWVIFPLLKVLYKSNDSEKAIEIFDQVRGKIVPEYLGAPIQSEIEVIKKHYRNAINILDSQEQNEHSVGQKLEVYFIWAMDVIDTKERIVIAKEGLNVQFDEKLTNNVPTLFSVGKLAVVANEYEAYIKIKARIAAINPDLKDLQEFARSLRPDWIH